MSALLLTLLLLGGGGSGGGVTHCTADREATCVHCDASRTANLALPVAIYGSAAALDLASTESALSRGANEGNPIMRGSFGKRVAVKSALVAGVVALDSRVRSKPARWAIRLGWVAAHAFVARRNWRQVRR